MADSDDEYNDRRKARDKFRRERNDYDRRDDRRGGSGGGGREPWENDRFRSRSGGRSRDVWVGNRNRDRRDNYGRDYDSRRRDRFSPQRHDMSPPSKRMRRDWDGDGGYQPFGGDMPYGGGGGGGPMHGGGPPPGWGGPGPDMGLPPQQGPYMGGNREPDYPTQPPVMTFKQFLSQQDDSIGEEEAIKRYNEYKIDFKRQQINEFFMMHKEEEWFKSRYHPEECGRRRDEQEAALRKRQDVFLQLLTSPLIEVTVDLDNSEALVKLLDAAVIKMEGGTDFDLTVLDMPEVEKEPEPSRSRNNSESVEKSSDEKPKKKKKEKEVKEESKTPDAPLEMTISPEQEELAKAAKSFMEQQKQQEEVEGEERKGKKRKRKHDKTEYSYESGSESDSSSDSEPEPGPPGVEDEPMPPGVEEGDSPVKAGEDKRGTEHKKEAEMQQEKEKDVDTKEEEEEGEDEEEEGSIKEEEVKPRALHKTSSIFLRNLAPTITQQEVEAVCKRYPGFMRVALQDPQPERRFFRRGWVTFRRDVNIKDICWNLNNIRLRDCELGATLNRELKQRIRPVSGITAHRPVVKQDIQIAAKVIRNLDNRWHLWEDPDEEKHDEEKECQFSMSSKNPVLKNITDYLVEEGSYEEEELLGQSVDEPKDGSADVLIDRDNNLLKALDRMILYLRIVHSIDYYSANEYPNEDEMPHRCGIMHARGSPPTSKTTQSDVTDWLANFEKKTKQFVELQDRLSEEEASKLGKKDPDAEVEKFVQANTQELGKDKWLCPLSGKKFKGPDFVRKHIFNKHCEKIDEVKQEVAFFNNYLMDPKRPQLPEHPGNKQQGGGGGGGGRGGDQGNNFPFQGPPQQGMMGYNQPRPLMMFGNGPGFSQNFGNREPFRGGDFRRPFNRSFRNNKFSSRRDPRAIIEYRDLDAPEEGDFF